MGKCNGNDVQVKFNTNRVVLKTLPPCLVFKNQLGSLCIIVVLQSIKLTLVRNLHNPKNKDLGNYIYKSRICMKIVPPDTVPSVIFMRSWWKTLFLSPPFISMKSSLGFTIKLSPRRSWRKTPLLSPPLIFLWWFLEKSKMSY